MDIIDTPQAVTRTGPANVVPQAQPIAVFEGVGDPLNDEQVRKALVAAEQNNQDPMSVTMADLQAIGQPTPLAQDPKSEVQVPEKFLKSDGAVDVEKIQASTRQLDEAIQKKEESNFKTVDDYMAEYREKENKFRNMPNLQKTVQQPVEEVAPTQMSDSQLEAMIRQDYERDPVGTQMRLNQIAVDKAIENRFGHVERKMKDDSVRENIANLAKNDPRILDQKVFDLVNKKIASDPWIAQHPNPHKAAWLEVKEELRLGELQAQAQPSRAYTPVLGGGTPPSAPSASSFATPQNVIANLDKLDIKDRRQEALGDEAVRAMLAGKR